MAYPAYNNAVDIPTNADTEGKWKALYAGAAGDIKVDTFGGDTATFTVVAGTLLPIKATKVYNSGTDVTNGKLLGLN
tara:strand:- start:223 stop:453 length:231 start_codon:yes stop_codon:yes gene_type:complete